MASNKTYNKSVFATKIGMSRYFLESGESVTVTVLKADSCKILEIKTIEKHGYSGVKVGFKEKKKQRCNKAELGIFNALDTIPYKEIREIRVENDKLNEYSQNAELIATKMFQVGDLVDVTGVSTGKGFAGVVKRFHVKGQPATRGTHEVRRHIGSVGCRKTPGRIMKNKKMPGRMGGEKVTVQNLKIINLNQDEGLLLVKGALPGKNGTILKVTQAIK